VVARAEGKAAGCGAIVRSDDGSAEIKRMFVSPAARGRKLGRRLLETLETLALRSGASVLQLETGVRQPEAIDLYRSAGFVEREPFGSYLPDPLSLFMEKTLGTGRAAGLPGAP
jgi:putative acetyltransferase